MQDEIEWMRRVIVRRLEADLVRAAQSGPCAKSKRAVFIVRPSGVVVGRGVNAQPGPFECDGSEGCRATCSKLCVHAEMAALRHAGRDAIGAHLIHVKAVADKVVGEVSGPPSCWQCSREILDAGISMVWLLHEGGWTPYDAAEFHRLTLEHERLPVITGGLHE